MQIKDYQNAVNLHILLKTSDSLIKASFEKNAQEDRHNNLMLHSKNIMHRYEMATRHMINIETDQLAYRKKQIGYYQSKVINNFTFLFASVVLIILILGAWAFIEFKKRSVTKPHLKKISSRLIKTMRNSSK